jgi:hypothetical protein
MKWILAVALFIIALQAQAQDYLGISKEQLIAIKGNSYKIDNKQSTISYDTPNIIGNDKGLEMYYYNSRDVIVGYVFLKNVYKNELLEIIKYNNTHFTQRSSGVKREMQWIDTEKGIEISLKTAEWTDNISFIFYKVFIVE